MASSNAFISSNEREALQWLIPGLDLRLHDIPDDDFKRAWQSLFYLHTGLKPVSARDLGLGREGHLCYLRPGSSS